MLRADPVPRADLPQLRLHLVAVVDPGVLAARREAARLGRHEEIGRAARDRRQAVVPRIMVVDVRERAEERLGVGMLGPVEEVGHRGLLDDLAGMREVRSEYLTSKPPASTAVQVAALVVPEALIEIDLVAVVPA